MSTTPASSPTRNTGQARTWRDKAGAIHLGADDIEITFAFPRDISHFDFWDCIDDAVLPCPVDLCILAKDSFPWTGKPFAIPDLTLFDIHVEDVPGPTRMVAFNPIDQFSTHYSSAHTEDLISDPFSDLEPGPKSENKNSKGTGKAQKDKMHANKKKKDHSLIVQPDKLTVDQDWRKFYVFPPAYRAPAAAPNFRIVNASTNPNVVGGGVVRYEHRGWTRTVWVPVPARLFVKRETRVLRVHARVWVNGDEERHAGSCACMGPFDALFGRSTPDDGNGHCCETDAAPLLVETLFSVSHLRSHREQA